MKFLLHLALGKLEWVENIICQRLAFATAIMFIREGEKLDRTSLKLLPDLQRKNKIYSYAFSLFAAKKH